ncbi:MAG: hypothetical protein COA58_14410 [Bacteroidetes bacterium]|nr:MAG: hypothetical protein COA58_14410 [Bacteroidota bacterium]
MKRNSILIFILLGLVIFEYGCDRGNRGGGNPSGYVVTGVESTNLVEIDTFNRELGTLKNIAVFGQFKIKTTFIAESVVTIECGNYAAYAIPQPALLITLPLDSIKIINVIKDDSLDMSSSFEVSVGSDYYVTEYKIQITNDSLFSRETELAGSQRPLSYNFYLKNQPQEILDYRFLITYYATNGDVFETSTEQFAIKP